MKSIVTAREKTPILGKDVFIADGAKIIGDVTIGDQSSIWYNSVIRGDVMPIRIGCKTNIQDGAVVHGTLGKAAASIGNEVTIGHLAILHGCDIGDQCLIGMGAIVMDNVKIPNRCIVGAGSLVTEGSVFEEESLILGRPAKAVRKLKKEELEFLPKSAENYIMYTSWY
jgi:carbonic anhydrase/acetyltransferase-like protein (isoleucine patch superfamily)